jgi:hypothetical protein
MDEDLWKKEKAWKLFKQDMAHDNRRNSNILDSYKKLEALHLSANSGNDRYTTISLKNQALIQARDLRLNGTIVQVDSDWGLRPAGSDSRENSARKDGSTPAAGDPHDAKEGPGGRRHAENAGKHHTAVPHKNAVALQPVTGHHPSGAGTGTHTPHVPLHLTLGEKLHADIEADELAHPLHRHGDRGPHMSTAEIVGTNAQIVSNAVSHMIRNRLNHAHFGESKLKKELFSIHTEHASTLTMDTMDHTLQVDETAQLLGGAPDHGAHAFCLVQLHRESSKNTSGGLLDNPKRMVRCYMRLCGACESTNAAKKLADTQMENIYLTLFRSDPLKEKELLLNWSAFKGYDSISLSDTDHFVIFCRGAPILYSSFSPSRNIFNSPYPALCKSRGQRYACIVVNKLNPLHAAKPVAQHEHHHHRHHHSHHHGHHHHSSAHASSHHSTMDAATEDTDSDEERAGKRNTKHGLRGKGGHGNSVHAMSKSESATNAATAETAPTVTSGVAPTATGTNTSAALTGVSVKVKAPAALTSGLSTKSRSNTEAEAGLAAAAKASSAENTTAAPTDTVIPTGNSEYLLEFSVLNEVLLTCANRMECLKYAITRFGTMTEPSAEGRLTTGESEGRVGAKGKIYVRPFNPAHPDRVLAMLHVGKRACVVPLFNWILINDDTMKTLDFTNGFNHAAQQLVFMEEELEHSRLSAIAFGGISKSVIGNSSASQEQQIDSATPLFKSFAEVGMLHSEHQINEDNSRYMPKNESLDRDRVTNARSLLLLERDLLSKEVSQQVIKQVANNGNDNEVSGDAGGIGSGYEGKRASVTSSSSFLAAGGRNGKGNEASNVEARLKALNSAVASVDKLMSAHDKLCEVEHNFELTAAASGALQGPAKSAMRKPVNLTVNVNISNGNFVGSTSTPQFPSQLSATTPAANAAVAKHNSLAKTKELIAKRMNVIESLQNLQFQRVTLDTVVEGYNARVNREIAAAVAAANQGAAPMKRSDSSRALASSAGLRGGKPSNQPNVLAGNLNFNPSPAALGTVAVGKRLSESIQLLSDSLAAKLK